MKDVLVQYHRLTNLSYLLPSNTICPLATEGERGDVKMRCKHVRGVGDTEG